MSKAPFLRSWVALGGFVLGAIATSVSHAENFPSAPRTPMAPGTGVYGRAIGTEDRSLMLPPQLNPAMRGGELQYVPTRQSPDLMVLETRAITDLSEGKSDVIISSRAETSLILQLYRPDLEGWQEYQLAPLSNTTIVCDQCGDAFRFSFNDGVEQSEVVVEPPSLLRIYSDSGDKRWKWDVLKLQAASSGAE